MFDLSLLTAATQSLGAMRTLIGGLVALRDEAKILEVQIELFRQLAAAHNAMSLLREQIEREHKLHVATDNALQDCNAKLSKKEQRELYEVAPGRFVLANKPVEGAQHSLPYFCQPCAAAGQEAVLRVEPGSKYKAARLVCPVQSSHSFQTEPDKPWPTAVTRDSI